MSANVFRFPNLGNTAIKGVPAAPLPPPTVPSLDVFDADQAKTLHAILENAITKGKVLSDLVHEDRELAAAAGLEGIGVEVSALLDTERLARTRDALREAVRLGEGATITHEGLGRLHRLESLVAEGSQVLGRHQGRGNGLLGRRMALGGLGAAPSSGAPDLALLGAVLALGAVVITLAAFLVTRKEAPHRPYFGGVPSKVPPRIQPKTEVVL